MKMRHKLRTAILLALVVTMLTVNGALAHATDDASLTHQILDSAWIPVLGLVALTAVSLSWWRARDKQQN